MDRRIIITLVIAAIALATVLLYFSLTRKGEEFPKTEDVGGKYNVLLSFWEDHAEIEYTDEDGKHVKRYFSVEMREGLDWIRSNTPEDSIFLCWWDYGHMIKGYAERDVVVRNPSEEILESVGDPETVTEFDPHEKILDVAIALTTSDISEVSQILEKYGVTHILVYSDDLMKAWWIYKFAGLNSTDYLETQDSRFSFNDEGRQTMIARLLENRDTGLTLIYEDAKMKVYKVD